MSRLKVEIVTPERRLAQLEADEVIAPGAEGLFGVRPGHTPYLSLMQPGVLTVREGATTTKYFVAGGFIEVGAATVRVLADGAEPVAEIDVAAAQKRLEAAQAKLHALQVTDPQVEGLRAVVSREAKRLEVSKLR